MLEKINLGEIFTDHWQTLYSFRELRRSGVKRTSLGDIGLFYVVPVILAGAATASGVRIAGSAPDLLLGAMAILAGLLLNLLVLLDNLLGKDVAKEVNVRRKALLGEIYANVLYSLVIVLTTLIPLVVIRLTDHKSVAVAASAVITWCLLHFTLTLLMVLKRMHLLLREHFT